MKTIKLFTLSIIAIWLTGSVSAQTADEIISKYLQAIGGKERLSKITSIYTEATIDAMGSQGTFKSTTLNGKGIRQDVDFMGSIITTCYNDKNGWSINPMTGSSSAEIMPETQYNATKDQIVIGGPFINYAEKGYQAELLGTDSVANTKTYKIKLTSNANSSNVYFFDINNFNLVQSIVQTEMQGQLVEYVYTFSDYRQADGYTTPYKMELNIGGGQFIMVMTVTRLELDRPVADSIFVKPL
jgi:hypothetical protein